MPPPPFLILGNPENRRISLFQEALAVICFSDGSAEGPFCEADALWMSRE